ncbi:MAG: hypothetical protein J0M24_21760 [Verrucomicrobia bacterium]|nr:hypothetical protein [Verrucomicrobiota bacterium]
MLFLTIGTLFGFDRLVKAVDLAIAQGQIQEEVFAQIGPGEYRPKHMKHTEVLAKDAFEDVISRSTGLISHAGIGSINAALKYHKPMVVLPRLKRFGEHVNDHQLYTARKFESLGCVLVAYEESDLPTRCEALKTFRPKHRTPNTQGIVQFIGNYLRNVNPNTTR